MVMQRKTKKVRRTGRTTSSVRRYETHYALPEHHVTYETALLKTIMAGHNSGRVSKHALTFYSLIANTTPSLRTLSYRHGIAAGRSLYKLCSQSKRYTLYEESVSDIVSFFEHAGFGRITYHAFPNRIMIGMHDMPRMSLGMSTHSFEAGMISGFLTASNGQLLQIAEKTCSSNAEDRCEFNLSSNPYDTNDFAIDAAFGAFVEDLSRQVRYTESPDQSIASEYYALSSLVLLDKKYFSEIRTIADYLGARLASELGIETMTQSHMLETVEKSVELLNFGVAKIKMLGKFDIALQFDKLHSRKEFTDLSIAFLHGFIRNATKGAAMNATCLIHNGTYTVRFRKTKQTKRKVH